MGSSDSWCGSVKVCVCAQLSNTYGTVLQSARTGGTLSCQLPAGPSVDGVVLPLSVRVRIVNRNGDEPPLVESRASSLSFVLFPFPSLLTGGISNVSLSVNVTNPVLTAGVLDSISSPALQSIQLAQQSGNQDAVAQIVTFASFLWSPNVKTVTFSLVSPARCLAF